MSTESQDKKTRKKSKPNGFLVWDRRVAEYFGTLRGRNTFLGLALSLCPLIVVLQCGVFYSWIRSEVTWGVLFGSHFFTVLAVSLFARRLSRYLLDLPHATHLRVKRRRKRDTADAESARFQEYRAEGSRVVVDGIAFPFGQSQSFFERAPWYRN